MKKATAIFLSLVLLLSSTQISYAVHLCDGQVVEGELGIGKQSLDCGMAEQKGCESDNPTQPNSISKKCCDNLQITIDTDNFQPVQNINSHTFDVLVPIQPRMEVRIRILENKLGVNGLSPPLVTTDFQVALQTFLI